MESKATPRRIALSKRPPPDAPRHVEVQKPFESSIDPEKKDVIERVYFDDMTGHRSIRDTWKQAREIDPNIKLKDVSHWKAELEPRNIQVAGYNSFIANAPFQEFQLDLFWMSKKKRKDRKKEEGGRGGGGGP